MTHHSLRRRPKPGMMTEGGETEECVVRFGEKLEQLDNRFAFSANPFLVHHPLSRLLPRHHRDGKRRPQSVDHFGSHRLHEPQELTTTVHATSLGHVAGQIAAIVALIGPERLVDRIQCRLEVGPLKGRRSLPCHAVSDRRQQDEGLTSVGSESRWIERETNLMGLAAQDGQGITGLSLAHPPPYDPEPTFILVTTGSMFGMNSLNGPCCIGDVRGR